ncbi:predicted protein [Aspergillus terreus NIH2624]|uniref:Uncharacterized protein n=1 Tax=Aspergillus terreus (strain NIH 2624 / FGSC A1156) TaxID=341663 RepID=Q0C8R5_ASPTN|nr:uncharacterized protein ATEG_09919 [Aspergillus terreus NIH2624]EAU30110.1 predicted protein [Aspergillus terreus NIH2624]
MSWPQQPTSSALPWASSSDGPLGGVHIFNHLRNGVYLWSVGDTSGQPTVLPAYEGRYFESWKARENGGISIKLATEDSQASILQFEYTLSIPTVYWDVSYIDMDVGSEFVKQGIRVTADDPTCRTITCPAGNFDCDSVYLEPDDDFATRGCPMQTTLTLTLGL